MGIINNESESYGHAFADAGWEFLSSAKTDEGEPLPRFCLLDRESRAEASLSDLYQFIMDHLERFGIPSIIKASNGNEFCVYSDSSPEEILAFLEQNTKKK